MAKYYKVSQCSELLNVSRATALRLAKKFNCVRKIGSRNYRVDFDRLVKCLEEQEG